MDADLPSMCAAMPMTGEAATALVHDYLRAMELRDLDAAREMLGDPFTMQFPGAAPMHALGDLVAWAALRYRSVRKTFEHFDSAENGSGQVVYCTGTLQGEWLDGSAFSGIRFIDRFEITGGRITRQDVWNDIGEAIARR